MLRSRARGFTLLARALQRSSAAPATSNSFASVIIPQFAHRHSSFIAESGVDGKKKPRKTPSFAIAAAFEGHENVEDNDGPTHLYGHDLKPESAEEERARLLKEQFDRGVEKKKLWMQSLVSQKLYAAVVKSVADCYAPLYAAMGMENKCPLLTVAKDEAKTEEELETQFHPLRFDDLLTKVTEQEAMALLVKAQKPVLVVAIVEHREKLAQELERRAKAGTGVVLPGMNALEDKHVVTMGSHFRMFYSWAMSAYSMCGRNYFPRMFEMYKKAQDAKVYVTANMNVQYLSALIRERRYDEVFEFYEVVTQEHLPTSLYFYRQLLFALSATRRLELLNVVLDDMRVKGFKLRVEDYLHAIRAYDNEYFLTERKQMDKRRFNHRNRKNHKTEEMETVLGTPRESYSMCLEWIREQEDQPEKFEKLVDASQKVLTLFDTMVDMDGLTPRHVQLFPRVITAAVYAQECERVPELLALHREHGDEPLHYAGVRMGVNALLLLDKPTEAWGLIRESNPNIEPNRFALMANVFSYLCINHRGADIIALMHDVDKLGVHGVFTVSLTKSLVPALCRSVDSVSDDELLKTVNHFDDIFRMRQSEHHFGFFLRECCHYGRQTLIKTAIEQWLATSNNKRPLKGSLGVRLLQAFEAESDWEFMTEVFGLIDFTRVNSQENCDAIITSIVQAYEALGEPERVKRAEQLLTVASKRQQQLRQRKPTNHHR